MPNRIGSFGENDDLSSSQSALRLRGQPERRLKAKKVAATSSCPVMEVETVDTNGVNGNGKHQNGKNGKNGYATLSLDDGANSLHETASLVDAENGTAAYGATKRHLPSETPAKKWTQLGLAASILVNLTLFWVVSRPDSPAGVASPAPPPAPPAPMNDIIVVPVPVPAPTPTPAPSQPSMAPPPPGTQAPAAGAGSTPRPCSGNGMKYELEEGGALGTDLHCECEPGFTGVECEREDFEHPVQATIGNPMLFQNYWWDNQAAFTETTAAYRLGYEASNAPVSGRIDFGGQMEVLEKAIRQTHRLVGNVRDVDSYQLIISPGSGDIIPAIMYALSNGSNIEVTAEQPFYSGYPGAVLAEQNDRMTFVETPSTAVTNGNTPLIEFITSPNNPDGTIRAPRFQGSTAIYDCAYWWPHFTPVSPKSSEIMMFTLSKLTGHAGTRVGWALIKDAGLARRIKAYVPSVSHDAQLRAATLLRYTVAQNGGPINFGLTEMTRRWDTFIDLFCADGAACTQPRNPHFTLQHPQLASGTSVCAFTGKLTRPNHPYSWIRCTDGVNAVGRTCKEILERAGVSTTSGDGYGAAAGTHVRLELLMGAGTFDAIVNRLRALLTGSSQIAHALPGWWQAPAPAALRTLRPPAPRASTSPSTCSGHGIYYPLEEVGLMGLDGHCECNPGYVGATCGEAIPASTAVEARAGNPLLFQEYWLAHQEANTRTGPYYRLGYEAWNEPMAGRHESWSTNMELLEISIRALHRLVGNVKDIDSYHIVVGPGSSPLIPASLFGLYDASRGPHTMDVTAQMPYYNDYPGAVRKLANSKFRWVTAPSGSPSTPTVEFVTSPNNPDGEIRAPRSSASMAVYDRAYWWPHFGPVSAAEDELMIFTLSKLTGHAGTRIGWALVKDQAVAAKMASYIHARGRVSHDGMLRASKLLHHMITTSGAPMHWAQAKMDSRWATLTGMLCANPSCSVPRNPDFVLREPGVKTPRQCAFTRTSRVPAPPYMWLECTASRDLTVDGGCTEVMRRAGIDLVAGESYGAAPGRFIRLELLMAQDTFDIVAQRLQALLSR